MPLVSHPLSRATEELVVSHMDIRKCRNIPLFFKQPPSSPHPYVYVATHSCLWSYRCLFSWRDTTVRTNKDNQDGKMFFFHFCNGDTSQEYSTLSVDSNLRNANLLYFTTEEAKMELILQNY